MDNNNNPLLCDLETGQCLLQDQQLAVTYNETPLIKTDASVKIIYFTDPICSTCWGIEPQLRKLKLEYGHQLQISYHMGGLLPDWSYNSGGISKPADVARHWDEVSAYYNMPIDGDIWLEDPLDSSYPPSIAFKAAQLQDEQRAILFLRQMREMVFLHKKNITKWELIGSAAKMTGLNLDRLNKDMQGMGRTLFYQDLELAKLLGVRGFPTLFITDQNGTSQKVYGYKPYNVYETALNKMDPTMIKRAYPKHPEDLFDHYPTLTTLEFTLLSEITFENAESILKDLSAQRKVERYQSKNGDLWSKAR